MRVLRQIAPLDRQFGTLVPVAVPDVLKTHLFGPVAPQDDQSPEPDTSCRTYAVLDGARIPNLPEVLAGSGLNHRCLFSGSALAELGDAAPWLVELNDGHSLTRNLFTHDPASPAYWDLWSRDAGIFLRSAAELDDVWSHVRKFTRLRDKTGAWFYFRFYAPEILRSVLASDATMLLSLLRRPIESVQCRGVGPGDWLIYRKSETALTDVVAVPTADAVQDADATKSYLADRRERRRLIAVDFLRTHCAPAMACLTADQTRTAVMANEATCNSLGIRGMNDTLKLQLVTAFWGSHFLKDPQREGDLVAAGWLDPMGDDTGSRAIRPLLDRIDLWHETTSGDTADPQRLVAIFRSLAQTRCPRVPQTDAVTNMLTDLWPLRMAWLSDDAIRRLALETVRVTSFLNLTGTQAMVYAGLTPYFGLYLGWDDMFPWARAALLDDGRDEADRIKALGVGVLDYIDGLREKTDAN